MNPFEKLEQYSINKLKQELADYKVNYFLQYHITGKLGEFSYVPIVERNMWELWQTGSALSQPEFNADNELAEFAKDTDYLKLNIVTKLRGKSYKLETVKLGRNKYRKQINNLGEKIYSYVPNVLKRAGLENSPDAFELKLEAERNTTVIYEGRIYPYNQLVNNPDILIKAVEKNIQSNETRQLTRQEERRKTKQDTLLAEAQEGTFHQSAYVSQRVNALAKIFNERNVDTADLNKKEVEEKIKLLSTAFREGDYVSLKTKLQRAFGNRNKNDRKNDLINRLSGENPSRELRQAVTEFVESPKNAFTKDALIALYRNNSRNDLADKLNNNLFKSYALSHSIYKGANEQDTQVDRFIVTELNAIRAVNTVLNSNARYFKWDVSDEHRRRGVICPVCYERSVRGYLNDGVYPRDMILKVTELHIPKHPYCLCKWTPLDNNDLTVKAINNMSDRTKRQIEESFGDWQYVSNNWSKLAPVAKGLLLASISMAGLWFAVSKYRLRKSNAVANIQRGVKTVTRGRVDVGDIAEDAIKYDKDKGTMIIQRPKTKIENPDGTITTVGNLILPVTEKVDGDTVLGNDVTNPSLEEAKGLTLGQKLKNEVKGTNKTVIKNLEAGVTEKGALTNSDPKVNLLESLKQEYEERLGLDASISTTPQVDLNLKTMTLETTAEKTEELISEISSLDKQVRELIGADSIRALQNTLDDTSKLTIEQRKQRIEELKEAINIINDKQFDIISFIKSKGEGNEEEILYSMLFDNQTALNNLDRIKFNLKKKLSDLIELDSKLNGKGKIKQEANAVKLLEASPELLDNFVELNNLKLRTIVRDTSPLFKKVLPYATEADISWEEIIENLLANKSLTEQKKLLRQLLDDTLKTKQQYINYIANNRADNYQLRGLIEKGLSKEAISVSTPVLRMNAHIVALNNKLDNVSINLSKVNAPKKTKANDLRIVNKVTKFIESLPSRKNTLLLDRSINDNKLNQVELLLNELKQRKLDSNVNIKKFFLQKKNPINIADTINSFNPTKINNYLSDLSKLKEGVETNISILNTLLRENKLSPTEIDKAKEQLRYLQERLAYYNSYQERLLQVGRDIDNLKKEGNYLSRRANYNIEIGSINIEAKTRVEKIRKLKKEAQRLRGKISNDRNKEDKTVLVGLLKRVEDEIRKTEIAEFRRYESNSNYLRYISATSNVLFSPIFKYMK